MDAASTDTTKANAEERTFDLQTTNGAVVILRQILAGNGWTKKVKQSRRAARMVKRLPKLRGPDGAKDEESMDAWAEELHPLSVGEADRDMCKTCIRWYVEEGRLTNTESTLVLLDEFGVTED